MSLPAEATAPQRHKVAWAVLALLFLNGMLSFREWWPTPGVLPDHRLAPEFVWLWLAMLVLVGQDAPTRTVLCAGAGNVEAAHITLTQGAWIGLDGQSPERLAEQMEQVRDRSGEMVPPNGSAQGGHEVGRAMAMLKSQ